MKKILLLFSLSLFVTTLSAQRFESDGLHFAVTSASTVEVVPSPSKYAGDITIPATVMHDSITYQVTTIGQFAFHNCPSLTSVVIPDGVISIGGWAFYKSPNLTSVSIPNTVTSIGKSAFADCSSLTSITLPNSLTSLAPYLFQDCSSLTSITLPQSITMICEYAFYGCEALKQIALPKTLTHIYSYAFAYCSSLTRIAIPQSVTSISYTAFAYCPSLDYILVESGNPNYDSRNNCNAIITTKQHNYHFSSSSSSYSYSANTLIAGCNNTTIPNTVRDIYSYAFRGSAIDSIFIPQSVTHISNNPFEDCRHLTRIIVDSTNTTYDSRDNCNAIIEKENCYYYKNTMEYPEYRYAPALIVGCNNTIIPNTVKEIEVYAFSGSSIDSIVIPKSIKRIHPQAFYNCKDIVSITVESGNTNYDSRNNCNAIITSTSHEYEYSHPNSYEWVANTLIAGCKNTVIPNTVTSIGQYAFYGNTSLTSINIPNSVSSIGSYAFYNCSALTSISIPNSVSNIQGSAFRNCSALTSINIPNNLSSISSYTFSGCTSLASISIPSGVTTIDSYAFENCSSLKSITIPWSVMSIGANIVRSCTSLSTIAVEEGNFYFDSRDNCNAIIATESNALIAGCNSTTIPNTVDSIGQYAFYNNTFNSITIPNSVKNIKSNAFGYCPNLFHITIPESVITIANNAFWGSSSLVSVTSLADTPATLGTDAFCSLPICNIPCGATANYTAAANWKSFVAGFDEMCEEIVEESQSICHGESYEWDKTGETYSKTGRYTYDTDSVQYILNLTVLPPVPQSNDSVIICHGETYTWNGQTYSTAGEYSVTLSDINGCDSVATLHLTIYDAIPETIVQDTICQGNTYIWNGQTYSTAGEYSVTLSNINGCDSVVSLHLSVTPVSTAEEYVTACDSYAWNDTTYTQSGDYTYTTTATNGCDSVVTLHLTINQTQYAEETVVACDSYVWNGETYTQSGDYTFTTVATNGCDSIVTLHLTIGNSKVGETEYVTICHGETYTWKGQTYTNSGDYSITLSSALGCDSIVTLHLTIMPEAFTTTETVVIGSNELPYTWRGNTYSATGHYTKTEQYTHVACDSAIHFLDLTVLTTGKFDEQSVTICDTEAPYQWYGKSYTTTGKYTYTEKYVGTDIDSIQHILNLTVHPTVYTEEHIAACNSYTWNGETYTQSGTYTYTTATINGCDSIVTLHLTISPTLTAEETITACDSYEWNGQTYTQSGEYTYTTVAANGCDSIVTLYLTINQTQYAEESVIACDSYVWNGQTYTQSGDYTYTTVAVNGCDSIVTLHLTISPTITAEETIIACDSYEWNGQTYTQSGEYVYTTTAANGCDSIVTLHLTINQTQYAEESVIACDSYEWNGQTYTQSGEYTYTTVASNSCDSIVTIHLTINQSEVGATEYATICDGETYTWNGQTYSTEGEYSIVLSSVNGCDSIATLHLTINPIQYADEYITACDSYEWNGQIYTQSGDYTYNTIAANGCDSIATLHLTINQSEVGATEYATICYGETYTWNGQTYSTEGEYSITLSNVNGCDSIVTLHLTILPEAIIMEESASINEEHLPYLWRGQQCYDAGKYIDSEPFANYPYCDSVIYVLNLTVEAPNKCGNNLYWHYSNNTLSITGSGAMYDNPDLLSYRNEPWYPARVENVVLPNTITHIGNVAFADCANLTNILIPNSVTSIGDGAFSWTGLQSVIIPASVTNLGEQVFETCNNLHTILYEGTPRSISNQTVHPFIGCVHLDTIITPAALWHCTTADPMLEARYGVPHKARYIEVTDGELTKQAMKYIAKNSGTVEVLDLSAATNTTLPLGALLNNYRLSTLYLPDQIEVIPEMLAEGCHSLAEILIPATVTEIGNYAFAGCTNIWRMTVEAVLPPRVYDKTFDGIDRSISLIVPAGSEELYRQAEYWKEFFIENTNNQSPISNCQKILHEDHILILREGKVYTTMGQLVK